LANLAGKTYEVMVADGKRWIFESEHASRSAALQQAEILLGGGKNDGVRVVAENERTGAQEVIFEEVIDRANVITIVPIDTAAPCRDLADFYRFPARRTAGRLLRTFLDDEGLTALELAFNAGQLMMFERNDRLFAPAMSRVGGIQAKATGAKAIDRIEELYKAFGQIKERARKLSDDDTYPALLKAKGVNDLIDVVTQRENEVDREFLIRGAFARLLREHGDWDAKLRALIELGRGNPKAEATSYLDEVAAEILDGAEAVKELLGGQADAAAANRMLIHLSNGNCMPPKNPISCIVELNHMLGLLELPLTRLVLLERVAREIGGTRRLTKEGHEAERDAFVGLVRELVDDDGLKGGPGMAEAVVKRARIALSETDVDLPAEKAIDRLLDTMPNRAVRIGFLLDLARSPLGDKENALITQALERLRQQLSLLSSLVPQTSNSEMVARVMHGLKGRLAEWPVSADLRTKFAATLDDLMTRGKSDDGKGGAKGATNTFKVDQGKKAMADPTGESKSIKAGEILFEEGEVGDMAFLIVSGEVEIYRKNGNNDRVLATLGRGEIIGEMSLIDSQPRVASARALQDTEVRLISRDSLQQRLARLEQTDRVLRRLIAVLVSRIRGQAQSPE
jgi:hypothetical protein